LDPLPPPIKIPKFKKFTFPKIRNIKTISAEEMTKAQPMMTNRTDHFNYTVNSKNKK